MNVLMNLSSHARAPLDHFATGCAAGLQRHVSAARVSSPAACATIATGDDYDHVDRGNAHFASLRGFAEFYFGIPCADRLRSIVELHRPQPVHGRATAACHFRHNAQAVAAAPGNRTRSGLPCRLALRQHLNWTGGPSANYSRSAKRLLSV
jgi:hypothetical protein